MTVFFTSDLHFGHRKVAALRGFGTTEEPNTELHDIAIRANWADRVQSDDVVYVLGDLCAGGRAASEHALDCLEDLPGRKRLILGNHDPAHPMNRDAHKAQEVLFDVFEFVAPFARIKVLGREVMLSHFPYERDRNEARYLQYRLRDEGLPLLHGHTHGTERLTVKRWPDQHTPRKRVEVHVGVDAWGLAPVPDTAIAALLNEGAGA